MHNCCSQLRRSPALLTIAASFLIATLLCFLFPTTGYAHVALSSPTMTVSVGFDSRYRDSNWIPVQITLRNDGPDFTGKISINIPDIYANPNSAPDSIYQANVNLPSGAQKQLTIYIPLYASSPGATQNLSIDLTDANGQVINHQKASPRSLGVGEILVGLLSDQPSPSFSALYSADQLTNPGSNLVPYSLNASNMPTLPAVLANFDLIILDHFTITTLSKEQLAALQNYVYQGGSLIVTAGPEWRKTFSGLPADLLPVTIDATTSDGTTTLPAGTNLLPILTEPSPSDIVKSPLTVGSARPIKGSSVILASNNTPLIVQANRGLGLVCYVGFDPTLDPVATWPGVSKLWSGLLLRSLGDHMLSSPGNMSSISGKFSSMGTSSMGTLLRSLIPSTTPSTWLILTLLLSYVLILGPIRLILVRRLKKRTWSWRIVLVTIVVFTLVTYGLAIQQKGTSIISASISVIQLHRPDASSTPDLATTYLGVYVPSQGDFSVHIPGNSLVRTSNNPYDYSDSGQSTLISPTPNGADVRLQGVDIWTMRSLVYQHEHQQKGGIISQLKLKDNVLDGTVTNTLPYALNDVYILIDHHIIALNRLAAGQSLTVHFSVANDNATGQTTIADQIAESNHISTPYYPDASLNNDKQRHSAMLSALSGEFICPGSNCYFYHGSQVLVGNNGNTISIPLGGNAFLNSELDPLLLPGAPATLIGWADRSPDLSDAVTINGHQPTQNQHTLIQAPLDMTFEGNVELPASLINGQLIDIHHSSNSPSIQTPIPGAYTLSPGGSVTFEFSVPVVSNLQPTNLYFSEPNNLLQNISSSGPGQISDVNTLQFNVYNWHTHQWDTFSMNSVYSLNISDDAGAYIDPSGRVLVQFVNTATQSAGPTAALALPSLSVAGNIHS